MHLSSIRRPRQIRFGESQLKLQILPEDIEIIDVCRLWICPRTELCQGCGFFRQRSFKKLFFFIFINAGHQNVACLPFTEHRTKSGGIKISQDKTRIMLFPSLSCCRRIIPLPDVRTKKKGDLTVTEAAISEISLQKKCTETMNRATMM